MRISFYLDSQERFGAAIRWAGYRRTCFPFLVRVRRRTPSHEAERSTIAADQRWRQLQRWRDAAAEFYRVRKGKPFAETAPTEQLHVTSILPGQLDSVRPN